MTHNGHNLDSFSFVARTHAIQQSSSRSSSPSSVCVHPYLLRHLQILHLPNAEHEVLVAYLNISILARQYW
jgi:hypothetical protein